MNEVKLWAVMHDGITYHSVDITEFAFNKIERAFSFYNGGCEGSELVARMHCKTHGHAHFATKTGLGKLYSVLSGDEVTEYVVYNKTNSPKCSIVCELKKTIE